MMNITTTVTNDENTFTKIYLVEPAVQYIFTLDGSTGTGTGTVNHSVCISED